MSFPKGDIVATKKKAKAKKPAPTSNSKSNQHSKRKKILDVDIKNRALGHKTLQPPASYVGRKK